MKTAEQWHADWHKTQIGTVVDKLRAIQRDAIEAAAQVCERTVTEAESPGRGGLMAGKVCAEAVRAMVKP